MKIGYILIYLRGNIFRQFSLLILKSFRTCLNKLEPIRDDFAFKQNKILNLYPNPAKDILNVEVNADEQIKSYIVYDATGFEILKQNSIEDEAINISELKSGIYLILIKTDKNTYKENFIKQ